MNKEEFIQKVEELGIYLTEEQLEKLNNFYKLLIEWNEKINLTRITEEEDVYLKHFYDSLTIVNAVNLKEKFDVVTARAVANIEKLLNYTMHLVSNDGIFIAMKGNIEEELTDEITKKINKKFNIITIKRFFLPVENSHRSLIVIKNK